MSDGEVYAVYDQLTRRLGSRSFLLRLLWARLTRGKGEAAKQAEAFLSVLLAGTRRSVSRSDIAQQREAHSGVGIYGMFHAEIGIGQSARRSALSFRANDFPISCHSLSMPGLLEEVVPFDARADLIPLYDTVLIHANADSLLHWAPTFPREVLHRRFVIGFWHWELPVFPARWAAAFDFVDEVWAPSQFTAASIAAATDKPVRIVPHAVPRDVTDQLIARKALGIPLDDFIILGTFDANSWTMRKNPLGMIRAFLDAFPKSAGDSPRLVIKVHGRSRRDHNFEEFWRTAATDDRIWVIDRVYSPEEMQLLQNACDVVLSLHRSEGYGLNIAEGMAVGKLAIATNFSGNVDFMNTENSIPIPYSMRAVGPGEYVCGDGQWWAEPDHDAAVEALRFAAERPGKAGRLALNGMRDMDRFNSFERVGRVAIAALDGATVS